MRVIYRSVLILSFICSTCLLSAQTGTGSGTIWRAQFYNVNDMFIVNKALRSAHFPKLNLNNGAYLTLSRSMDSVSIAKLQHLGESSFLKTNGPVQTGNSIIVLGRSLQPNSVNIDIVDTEGRTVTYKETDIAFDEEQKKLTISTPLKPGIYTLHIPVADGIASKTVIVQKAGASSWRTNKH